MMDKCLLLVSLVLLLAASAGTGAVPPPKPAKPDMLVGAYYFPGWNKAEKWYCMAANKDVLHPLLGYYREGDPDAADWHIKWALDHGVSFFAFDFYTSGGSQMLETALDDGFLKAKYIDRFKFCLNWCNHADQSTMTAEQLDQFGDLVIKKYLTHPSYLRIDGKPVVIFLVGQAFIRNLGLEGAKKAFGDFQQKAKDAGLPGVYMMFCQDAMGPNEVEGCKAVGVSAIGRYNYPYAGTGQNGPVKHAEFSYEHLTSEGVKMWEEWTKLTGGDYWPTVMAGWDRRPWCKSDDVIITGMTPELFANALTKARDYVSKDKVVMIEAWNEWGEGSILEPSIEHGFAYLDAVRNVFCPKAGPHKDVDPKSLGLPQPAFDLKLPSSDTWRFDSDTDGWTGGGIDGLHNEWGAIVATSTSADPSITSPITYLQCKRYSKARIRMMASVYAEKVPVGGPDVKALTEATGELFWSTTEHGTNEAQSVLFKVQLDSKWHEYELDLKSNPNWKGVTDRLRFDPADLAGVRFVVDEICVR
jgi:hypothetical protein